MTTLFFIAAALAWWLLSTPTERLGAQARNIAELVAFIAIPVYTAGATLARWIHQANDTLARVASQRPAPRRLAAAEVFGPEGFILLDEEALEQEILLFEAPAPAPAPAKPKRRRAPKTKVAKGG